MGFGFLRKRARTASNPPVDRDGSFVVVFAFFRFPVDVVLVIIHATGY